MRFNTALGCAAVAAILSGCTLEPATPKISDTRLAGVATVIDGDTIDIHGERIRLSGFDAPEAGRKCLNGAGETVRVHQTTSLALADFIAGRTVTCARSGKDVHGRTVATCTVGGEDLGSWMVEHGHARDWPRYSKEKYAPEEARARAAKRGIWAMTCPGLWGDRSLN
jgi:endonuclease YncB( thermonuclease family)